MCTQATFFKYEEWVLHKRRLDFRHFYGKRMLGNYGLGALNKTIIGAIGDQNSVTIQANESSSTPTPVNTTNKSNWKACYWICTSPAADFKPHLPANAAYIKGQREIGESGYDHWQFIVYFKQQQRLGAIKKTLGDTVHAEPTRSDAAEAYVWKDDTAVDGTRFEFGTKSIKRNKASDWDNIRRIAEQGLLESSDIPSDIYVRCYHSLRSIAKDHAVPAFRGKQLVHVYWGKSGAGKSYRAFLECGDKFYLKSPTTKWWDGYRGQENIVIDEFRGVVDISHVLKWLDETPCSVEIKGSQVPLMSKKWWITSNIGPSEWYPNLDHETKCALMRRISCVEYFDKEFIETE